jgi:sugar phosphate isomerase/epimerase
MPPLGKFHAGGDCVYAAIDSSPKGATPVPQSSFHAMESQCIVGEGRIPIAEIYRQLEAMRYRGYVNLEYEIDADDPMPG